MGWFQGTEEKNKDKVLVEAIPTCPRPVPTRQLQTKIMLI
jgi:hypothetical protein